MSAAISSVARSWVASTRRARKSPADWSITVPLKPEANPRRASSEIENVLGYVGEPELIHRDNLVLL